MRWAGGRGRRGGRAWKGRRGSAGCGKGAASGLPPTALGHRHAGGGKAHLAPGCVGLGKVCGHSVAAGNVRAHYGRVGDRGSSMPHATRHKTQQTSTRGTIDQQCGARYIGGGMVMQSTRLSEHGAHPFGCRLRSADCRTAAAAAAVTATTAASASFTDKSPTTTSRQLPPASSPRHKCAACR